MEQVQYDWLQTYAHVVPHVACSFYFAPRNADTTPHPVSAVKYGRLICASPLLAREPCSADSGCFALVQAESVRKAEEERMKREAKEALLRANKERLDRLQAAWKEDQQLKEVPKPCSFCLYKQYTVVCGYPLATTSKSHSLAAAQFACLTAAVCLQAVQVIHNRSWPCIVHASCADVFAAAAVNMIALVTACRMMSL